ncbi:helix-turn-helix domain-containing protein [Persicobacter psychrovividus]|uniref:HTH araC/xylS-type domain-containing protein n=1 Tax=Persicobacter psychrovividus TaxID=387638 RepID=A0ABN6LCX4_9BACT|nr:hypothetical protein PEPS_30810 [Persicobacter psychrovividus]
MTVTIFLWAFLQSLLLGFAILFVKRSSVSKYLSAIFLAMAVNIFAQYQFRYTNVKFDFPELLIVADIFDFLLPALVMLYLDKIFEANNGRKRWWYFAPAATVVLAGIVFILSHQPYFFETFINSYFHLSLLAGIVLWRIFTFIKIRNQYQEQYTNTDAKQRDELKWPKVLVGYIGLLLYVSVVQFIFHAFIDGHLGAVVTETLRQLAEVNYVICLSSIIFVTIYFALKYPKLFSVKLVQKKTDKSEDRLMQHYLEKMEVLIAEKKVYLESDFNEKLLAELLGTQAYVVSKLVNEYIGKSFSEYINEKRVAEAKHILAADTHKQLTNFAVAVDSGFRSESVFYVNFKKITGMTPRQYRKSLQASAVA